MHVLALAAILLGLHGDPARFQNQTGQQTQVVHTFVTFSQTSGLERIDTGAYGAHETAAPKGIAQGKVDTFLFRLNGVIADFDGDRFYVRPFPELNAYWEASSAYNRNGTRRDDAHSTAWNKKAFARIAIILRGGLQADVNAKLAKLGLPAISRDLPLTTPKLRMVWSPQGFGAPNLPGNSAQAYHPGDAYVDVVGDDLYDIRGHGATWAAAPSLYAAHPSKAFAFPEWGLWGVDDPSFVRAMATWVRSHRRTELIAYYAGQPGSVFDLASKPASRAAYRSLITPLG